MTERFQESRQGWPVGLTLPELLFDHPHIAQQILALRITHGWIPLQRIFEVAEQPECRRSFLLDRDGVRHGTGRAADDDLIRGS